jgi:hypothetical protein
VLVPVRVGLVIMALEQDAVKRSATAAKELRAYLSAYPPQDVSVDLPSLECAMRVRIYARLGQYRGEHRRSRRRVA